MTARAGLLALAAGLLLAGCQLSPIYAGGSKGAVMASLGAITIAPIQDRSGWLVRQSLIDRIGDAEGNAAYRLEVALDDRIEGFGVRTNDAITRERRTLRARYQLVDARSGEVMVDATAASDAGIDVVNSEYATIAAENSALERLAADVADQIVTRLALFARARPNQP